MRPTVLGGGCPAAVFVQDVLILQLLTDSILKIQKTRAIPSFRVLSRHDIGTWHLLSMAFACTLKMGWYCEITRAERNGVTCRFGKEECGSRPTQQPASLHSTLYDRDLEIPKALLRGQSHPLSLHFLARADPSQVRLLRNIFWKSFSQLPRPNGGVVKDDVKSLCALQELRGSMLSPSLHPTLQQLCKPLIPKADIDFLVSLLDVTLAVPVYLYARWPGKLSPRSSCECNQG